MVFFLPSRMAMQQYQPREVEDWLSLFGVKSRQSGVSRGTIYRDLKLVKLIHPGKPPSG